MSRILKFRAWDKVEKEMVEHEDLLIKVKAINEFNNYYDFMQYTGLHDETDDEVEIYEGDIVEFEYKCKTYIGKVEFEAGAFILVCDDLLDGYILMFDIIQFSGDYYWIEGSVLGNIYENRELLKGVD